MWEAQLKDTDTLMDLCLYIVQDAETHDPHDVSRHQ
jgi:hypothetical protein